MNKDNGCKPNCLLLSLGDLGLDAEMKIPPPIQALLAAGAMWAIAMPDRHASSSLSLLAVGCWVLGVSIALVGIIQFKQHKTTVNPIKLNKVSSLVTSGIYAYTRNPMYVGLAVLLIGWGVWLGSTWSLIVVPVFIFTMTTLQIKKEEQVLTDLFGQEYIDYMKTVRRWL